MVTSSTSKPVASPRCPSNETKREIDQCPLAILPKLKAAILAVSQKRECFRPGLWEKLGSMQSPTENHRDRRNILNTRPKMRFEQALVNLRQPLWLQPGRNQLPHGSGRCMPVTLRRSPGRRQKSGRLSQGSLAGTGRGLCRPLGIIQRLSCPVWMAAIRDVRKTSGCGRGQTRPE